MKHTRSLLAFKRGEIEMTKEDVAYDLLVDVFDVFFKHMRADPRQYDNTYGVCDRLLELRNEQLEAEWDKDWDALSRPILNRIEEVLDKAEIALEEEWTGEAKGEAEEANEPRRSCPSNPRHFLKGETR